MGHYYLCDIGNTRTKIAKVIGSEIVHFNTLSAEDNHSMFDFPEFDGVPIYLSNVGRLPFDLKKIPTFCSIIDVGSIPRQFIDYETPETLGIDRVMAAFGAFSNHKVSAIIVDSGSATTIDVIDKNGVFQGGVIAPGLDAIHIGMHQKTPRLPHVNQHIPQRFPGKTSEECIQLGTNQFFIDAVVSMVNRCFRYLPEARLFVLGGNASVIAPHLDKAEIDALLLFRGMKYCVEQGWFRSSSHA